MTNPLANQIKLKELELGIPLQRARTILAKARAYAVLVGTGMDNQRAAQICELEPEPTASGD